MRRLCFLLVLCACSLACSSQGLNALTNGKITSEEQSLPDSLSISIPGWVKEKTTPDEYALWKRFSQYFEVDYSILQEQLSEKQHHDLYKSMRDICTQIENHTYPGSLGGAFYFVLPAPIDSTIVWNTCSYVKIDENLSFRKIEGIVFHSKDYPEAQVKVIVWCVYDKAKNSVQVIKEDMQKAGQAIEVNGSHTVGYDSANGRLYGSCGGSLVYWDEHKAYQSEDFYKGYNIPLE